MRAEETELCFHYLLLSKDRTNVKEILLFTICPQMICLEWLDNMFQGRLHSVGLCSNGIIMESSNGMKLLTFADKPGVWCDDVSSKTHKPCH